MKKYFLLLVFLSFISVCVFTVSAQTENFITGEHIENFNEKVVINKNGTIDVTEKILYDFATLERHGIYRNIPYIKQNKEGKKFRMDIKVHSVQDETGRTYNFTQNDNDDELQLKIGDADKTMSGRHTYVITYTVAGALTYFSDHDELYWNITGNGWTIPIRNVYTEVTLPQTADGIKSACYTGAAGSTATNCKSEIQSSTVAFTNTQPLYFNEGMTIVVGFPQNIVAVLEPKEVVNFWDTIAGKLTLAGIILAAIIWYIILPLWIPFQWYTHGRDPNVNVKEVRAWFDPPQKKDGMPLTPAETGVLIDETADLKDILSIIVDLARRGYLKIVEKDKDDFYLQRTKKSTQDLKGFEATLFQGIFKGEDEIRIKDEKLYDLVERVKNQLYKEMVDDGFFPEDPQKMRTIYSVLSVIGLSTGNLLLAFTAFVFGRAMARRTPYGAEQLAIAKSLRNFLSSQDRQLEFQAKEQMFFEKLLPFAVAFGVEKIWAERFKDLDLRQPDWYQGYPPAGGVRTFHSDSFVRSMNSSFSQIRSSATPTSSSSGFSSGFSGGSSGGGGGGGGGGSW